MIWFCPCAGSRGGGSSTNIAEELLSRQMASVIRLLHFTVSPRFKRQEEVRCDWKDARLRNLSDTDRTRDESKYENGFSKRVENWIGREMAYPTNVLQATECGFKGHPAAFPKHCQHGSSSCSRTRETPCQDPFAGKHCWRRSNWEGTPLASTPSRTIAMRWRKRGKPCPPIGGSTPRVTHARVALFAGKVKAKLTGQSSAKPSYQESVSVPGPRLLAHMRAKEVYQMLRHHGLQTCQRREKVQHIRYRPRIR